MDKLMQALFDDITCDRLGKYYNQTGYWARSQARDAVGRRLWERLEGENRDLLEELQRAYDDAQLAELEAMFLASFDQSAALFRTHVCVENNSLHTAH